MITTTSRPPVSATQLQIDVVARGIRKLGIANTIVAVMFAATSWGMAVIAPPRSPEPLEARWFERIAAAFGGGVGEFIRGNSLLADARWFVTVYALLVLALTTVFIWIVRILARERTRVEARHAQQMLRWSIVFATVLGFAVPVLVQDFWLSAGWGRLVVDGVNPYYVSLNPEVTRGLPLDYLGLLTTYGPLWTLISGGVMLLAGDSGLVAGILFKAVICGAWIAALMLVRRLMRDQTPWLQCLAMAIAGWLPLTLIYIIADGHNDIAMVVLILAWLFLLERGRPLPATAALAASVVMKYLSAPLLLLDLLHSVRSHRGKVLGYLPNALIAALIGLGILLVFYRSPAFFSATAHMADWHFFTPRDAIVAVGRLAGIEPGLQSIAGAAVAGCAVLLQLFFVSVAVFGVVRYARSPTADTFRSAVFAVSAGILFGVVGHLWPWFLAWVIFMAALKPDALLTRWAVGVALAMPFALLFLVMYPTSRILTYVTPPFYLIALAWFVFAPRNWFRDSMTELAR